MQTIDFQYLATCKLMLMPRITDAFDEPLEGILPDISSNEAVGSGRGRRGGGGKGEGEGEREGLLGGK